MLWNVRYGDEDCVTDESFFDDGDEPGRLRRRKSPPKPVETSLAGALADDRWDACEKWTFAHASAPYPSAEDKAALARKTGWPPGSVDHWFSNMRKRKYLKLGSGPGQHAPRDPFEAQLYALKERVTPVPKFASKGPAERPDVERAVDLVGRAVTDLRARPDAGRAVEVLAAAALAAADDDDDDMIAASAVSFVSPP